MVAVTDMMGFTENRNVPWHNLGDLEATGTAQKRMLTAGLGTLVQLFPVYGIADELHQPLWDETSGSLEPDVIGLEDNWKVHDESHFLVVRTSDRKILGMVGSQYKAYQNWKMFKLAEELAKMSGATYDTCGPLNDGKVIWVSLEYPEPMLIGGGDEIRRFLIMASSHDGSMALSVFRSNVRVSCMNTLNSAMREAPQIWKVRHSGDMELKLEEVKRNLDLSAAYDVEFGKTMNWLIEQSYTKKEFEKMVRKLVPSKTRGDGAEQTQMAMIGVLESSATIDDSFRYTKYGAFNAVAEYLDWIRPRRGSSEKSPEEQQVNSLWFGSDMTLKNKSLAALLQT